MNLGPKLRCIIALFTLVAVFSFGFETASASTRSTTQKSGIAPKTTAKSNVSKNGRSTSANKKSKKRRSRRYYVRYNTSSFDASNTEGDVTDGEDLVVRNAAVEALGNMNGTLVAIDPETGRILTMVNQKLALSEGAQPCSTFKTAVGIAALSEGLITRETTLLRVGRRKKVNIDLTYALAHSNNPFFELLGRRLGFEKIYHYAQQFGFGELAGFNIEGEHLGAFPMEEISAKLGGVAKMCSFGEGISMTPLQLGAMTVALANGGNLFYLQHPRTPGEVLNYQPRLKRTLDIANLIPEVAEGLWGAVEYGTARSLRYNFMEEPVLGKTGTCSKDGTRYGWFASYAKTDRGRIVTIVFLRGGRPTYGPRAAEIAGVFYHKLYESSFFADSRSGQESNRGVSGMDE